MTLQLPLNSMLFARRVGIAISNTTSLREIMSVAAVYPGEANQGKNPDCGHAQYTFTGGVA